MVSGKNFCVALFNGTEILVLYVHLLAHAGIGGRHRQSMEYALHFGIIAVGIVVKAKYAPIVLILACLVKNAQHLV